MTSNPFPLVPILWVAGSALTLGGTAWGIKALSDQVSERRSVQEQAAQQQQIATNVQQLQLQMLLEQTTPLLVLGTVAMAGVGALLLARSNP